MHVGNIASVAVMKYIFEMPIFFSHTTGSHTTGSIVFREIGLGVYTNMRCEGADGLSVTG